MKLDRAVVLTERALCPAPDPTSTRARTGPDGVVHGRGRCLAPLPCAAHNVPTPVSGMLIHGQVFIERVHPPLPWWRRIFSRR